MAPWDSWTKNQKIAALAAGGLGGLYFMHKMGGASASIGGEGSGINVLDVRRPTDDINAVGGRDPNAWLLREIFRDLRKDQGQPVVPPPVVPPPGGDKPPRHDPRHVPTRVSRGSVTVNGRSYHSGQGREDNFIVNRAGRVLVRGVIGDEAWRSWRVRLGLAPIPDPRDPRERVAMRPETLPPPPNSGRPSPQKFGHTRGS